MARIRLHTTATLSAEVAASQAFPADRVFGRDRGPGQQAARAGPGVRTTEASSRSPTCQPASTRIRSPFPAGRIGSSRAGAGGWGTARSQRHLCVCRAAWMVGNRSAWLVATEILAGPRAGERMAPPAWQGREHGRDGVGASEKRKLPGGVGRHEPRAGGAARARRTGSACDQGGGTAKSRMAATPSSPATIWSSASDTGGGGQAGPGGDRPGERLGSDDVAPT